MFQIKKYRYLILIITLLLPQLLSPKYVSAESGEIVETLNASLDQSWNSLLLTFKLESMRVKVFNKEQTQIITHYQYCPNKI